jgi:hypothetical protein
MSKESSVWEFFEKVNKFEAKCKLCSKVYKISLGSTSTITSHAKTKHSESWNEHIVKNNEKQRKRKLDEENAASSKRVKTQTIPDCFIKSQKFSSQDPKQLKFDLDLTKFFCKLGLPFEVLDDEGAQEFIDEVNNKYTVKCATTFRRQKLPLLYERVKEEMQRAFAKDFPELKGVSFTTDIWTSRNNDSYISLTLHYINSEFELVRFLIACTPFSGRHTGAAIAVNLDSFISDLNLDEEVHRACVNDNGSNVVLAAKESEEINTELRCNDHTLQLVVTKAIKNSPELQDGIKKCTDLASHTHRSAPSTSKLQDECEKLGIKPRKLIVPCTTRWNSEYMCVRSVLQVKEAVQSLAQTMDEFDRFCPSDDQWKTLENCLPYLQKVNSISETLSADKRPTIQEVIPELFVLQQELSAQENHKHKPSRKFFRMLKDELQKRYPLNGAEKEINCLANFLDPRYKGLHLMEYKKLEETKKIILSQEKEHTPSEEAPTSVGNTEEENDGNAQINYHELLRKRLQRDISPSLSPVPSKLALELDHYLDAKSADEKVNILGWWKIMHSQYPILSTYARKYLCIPASSATSERAFSTAGNVVTCRRTTLAVENVEKIVFIKENINKFKIRF